MVFLAVFGTIELEGNGAGGGQGPNPISTPGKGTHVLQVQVIAQQWKFAYRWPAYGGVETPHLELPADTTIEFHVTSLDVIHSFWAYQLGVKADANPGVDNVAYVTTKAPLNFEVHCAELCGVWHGYMYATGPRRPQDRVRALDRPAAEAVRAGDQVAAAICPEVLPATHEEGRMTAITMPAGQRPAWRRPARLQPVDRDRAGGGRMADRRPDRLAIHAPASATSAPRPGRTTSRCCSATCSA